MAIINDSNQYRYTGKGPLDPKTLVKKYTDLLSIGYAYNGMIVTVWNDEAKNGMYVLRDPSVTSALGTPKVDEESNWHRIAEVAELAALTETVISAGNAVADLLNRTTELEGATNNLKNTTDNIITVVSGNTDSIATLVNSMTSVESNLDAIESGLAALTNIISSNTSDIATLLGKDVDNETGRANLSIRAIAADEINTLIKAADDDGGKVIENIANLVKYVDENASDIAALINSTNNNTDKLKGIKTTVVAAIADAVEEVKAELSTITPTIDIAAEDTVGGIKSAAGDDIENKVTVDETGIASVSSVNVNTLTQTAGDTLVLNGGAAAT